MKAVHTKLFIVLIALLSTVASLNAQEPTYPPSCVITMPHTNAYFKVGTDVQINVYSTDIGKTANNGTVAKVEFYADDVLIGEATEHTNNTYSFTWGCVAQGEHRIYTKATNSNGVTFTSAGVLITVGVEEVTQQGMSSCKGKYLANIVSGSVPNQDYLSYWNGVTSENGSKWGSVESTRDNMSWGNSDLSYNYAADNNLMFRYHAIAWGNQYPSWLSNLQGSVAEFRGEVEEYMAAIAERYPYIDQIDVLNENMHINTYNGEEHAAGTPIFRAGMGGPGETGYDWAIWLFEKAREYFPNSKLVMNDFELESNEPGINEMLAVVKVLRDRGLIDGFGTQAHTFNVDGLQNNPQVLNSRINLMASGGVPVYVTELDLNGGGDTGSEAGQLTSYTNLFPVYWNNPSVAGITLWGYVEGATWKSGTGLLNSDRSERSAMAWLRGFVGGLDDVGYPFCQTSGCTDIGQPVVTITEPSNNQVLLTTDTFEIIAEATDSDGNIAGVEFYMDDIRLDSIHTEPYSIEMNIHVIGTYTISVIAYDNDGNSRKASLKVQINIPQSPYNGIRRAIPGKIEFEEFDLGGNNSAYYDIPGNEGASVFRADEDVDIEACTDEGGGYSIGYAYAGEWLEYSVDVAESGVYTVDFRMANDQGNKKIFLSLDNEVITPEIIVPNTGGWQSWQNVTYNGINLSAGEHILRSTIGSANFINMNYMTFSVLSGRAPYGNPDKAVPGIIEAEHFDFGGEGIAFHEADENGNEGNAQFRTDEGVDISITTDATGQFEIDNISNGEWLEYTFTVNKADIYNFIFRTATGSGAETIRVNIDGEDVSGAFALTNSGGLDVWINDTLSEIELTQGTHLIRVLFESDNIALNYFKIEEWVEPIVIESISASSLVSVKAYADIKEKNIRLETSNTVSYTLSSMQGTVMDTGTVSESTSIGYMLGTGVYILQIQTANGQIEIGKIFME